MRPCHCHQQDRLRMRNFTLAEHPTEFLMLHASGAQERDVTKRAQYSQMYKPQRPTRVVEQTKGEEAYIQRALSPSMCLQNIVRSYLAVYFQV
jgi:hypothetical protein